MVVLRRALARLISAILALSGLLLILSQGLDLNGWTELLPLGFFAVVLSLAAYAMIWCSNGKALAPPVISPRYFSALKIYPRAVSLLCCHQQWSHSQMDLIDLQRLNTC